MEDNFDTLEDYKKSKKIVCVNCGKEAKDFEKVCPYCDNFRGYNTENYNERLEKIIQRKNSIAVILNVIAYLLLALGFILGIIFAENPYNDSELSILLGTWLTYGSISLGLFVSSEIIQILHDIRYRVWNMKK